VGERVKRALLLALVVVFTSFAARADIPQKLKDGLQASSTKVRIVAISGIAKSDDPSARGLLEPMLADSDAAVRAAAVEGLGRVGDPAALKALERLRSENDDTVKKVLARVVPLLEALRVQVDVGELQDITKGQVPGLIEELQAKVKVALEKELGGQVLVKKGDVTKGYGFIIGLRYIKKYKDGANSILEVKCEGTIVEIPGKILRLSTNATAGAGLENQEIPKSMEAELARDGINACAESLAKDFADYARQRVLHR
jgi:hypothetical protein